ncbi:MAG TPA: cyclopropane-fatty-acyl-phospholipid synthase family protein [Nitrospirota bacterium]|nr:cyclopropane-fatty-acyl-phospholipid synthase family protein [Nitrospirota bacterium]
MNGSVIPSHPTPGTRIVPATSAGLFAGLARRAVFSHLRKIERGSITVIDGGMRHAFGTPGGLVATITVHDPAFYTDMAFGGSIGAGEAYMAGFWSTDDLVALVRIIVLNRRVLMDIEGGLAAFAQPLHWLMHALRKNTREGSRKNIEAHYDLGNDFYSLWLDRTMTYSCNIFDRDDATLEEAATAKYDRICRKLSLKPDDRVLEIGAGWGGFAIHAAKNYGCRVTTTTISRQQYDWAKELIAREGVADRVVLLFEDYRELTGKYDKLVSIEMIEAVGHHFLDTYLKVCSDRMKDESMMALQAIIIEDQAYEAQIKSVDFIRRYIFPGGFIPSITAITRSLAKVTDLRLFHLEDLTPHYARTLQVWRERFFANIDAVRKLGYPEIFIRMWEYYLCYCEGAFRERYIGSAQMVLTKPDCRP